MLALGAAGCGRKPAAAPPAIEVEVAPVVQKDVPVVSEWVGTLDGDVNADIRPKVEGYVLHQLYKDGALVRAGQALFEIDPRQFRAALEQAKGALGEAEAQLAKATKDVERFTPLAAERAVSQQELDDAHAAQRTSQAAVDAARAAVDQAALNLGWTKVTSPIDGITGIARAQVGNLVNTQTVMTTVSHVNPIRATFGINEQEYLQLAGARLGAPDPPPPKDVPLTLVLEDGSVYPSPGRIIVEDRQVDVKTGTLTVQGRFPNPGNVLRPGQYARVKAALSQKAGALLVPQRAVIQLQGGYRVAVVAPDGKVDVRAVDAAERVGDLWVIDKGLKPGERVAVTGLQFVKSGVTVKTRPETSNGAAQPSPTP